ncbi:hypothetical protein FACS189488_09150 [Betaproteobacteria bacterium]|nr:hypothetical protein FACS189488_09150 [Betaproteobacteria bacterium]
MKKKFLAVNVALALGAMTMSGLASAGVVAFEATPPVLGLALTAATAAQRVAQPGNVVVSQDHIGLINVVPYYSVQEGNTVALSITNNDRLNGKAVKVRFRGAQWSDDVLDFQVFLSPGDIWTAALTKQGDVAVLNYAGDTTCTRPQLNPGDAVPFHADTRVAGSAGNTLEGYVEIITLADIPPVLHGGAAPVGGEFLPPGADFGVAGVTHTNPLYTVTKHVGGAQPPCRADGSIYQATIGSLIQDSYWVNGTNIGASVNAAGLHLYTADPVGLAQPNGAMYDGKSQFGGSKTLTSDDWLQFPTANSGNGISSYVTIINVQDRKAFTLQATALKNAPVIDGLSLNDTDAGNTNDGIYYTAAVPNAGNPRNLQPGVAGSIKAYFAQFEAPVAWAVGQNVTADKLFGNAAWAAGAGAPANAYAGLDLLELDLPDLSTPTTAAVAGIGYSLVGATAASLLATAPTYPGGAPAAQRDLVASALQSAGFSFEYITDLGLSASTDIVLNQPVRRYYYWYTNVGAAATNFHREFVQPPGKFNVFGEINTPYTGLLGASNSINTTGVWFTGREEQTVAAAGGSTWSPLPPSAAPLGLIGEVSVLAINGKAGPSDALGASLTKNFVSTSGNQNGWGYYDTVSTGATTVTPAGAAEYGYYNPAGGPVAIYATHPLLKDVGAVRQIPFVAYGAINVYSPASNAVYGTTLPVRRNLVD